MVLARLPFRLYSIASSTRLATRPRSSNLTSLTRANGSSWRIVRGYATPAKPKKGSIGATAKRGRAAPKKAASTTKKPGPKKTASKTKTAAAAKKTAAAKRTAASKAKKTAASAKKKAQALKLKAQKQSERAKAKTPEEKIKVYKRQALSPPKITKSGPWLIFWAAKARNNPEMKGKGLEATAAVLKAASAEYKQLSASEKESYTRSGKQARAQAEKEYQAWVERYTPEEIRQANLARSHLRILLKTKGTSKYGPIKDERKISRPPTPYLRFASTLNTGATDGIPLKDKAKDAGRAWKELDAEQKQKFQDAYAADYAKYKSDYERVYGRKPGTKVKKTST